MTEFYPWNKESEMYFKRLVKWPNVEINDVTFTQQFGRRHPELIDNGYVGIGRIKKKRRSVLYRPEGIEIIPIQSPDWRRRKFTKFKFFKIL